MDDDKILEITNESEDKVPVKVTGKKRKRKTVSEKLPTISSSSSSSSEVPLKKEKKYSRRGRPRKSDIDEIIIKENTNNNNDEEEGVEKKKTTTLIYNIKYNRKSIKTKYLINHVDIDDFGRILQSIFKNEFYKYQYDIQVINTSKKNIGFFGIKHPKIIKRNRSNKSSYDHSIFYERTLRPPSSYERTISGNPVLFVVDNNHNDATMEMNRYLNDLRLKKSPKMKLIENDISEDYIEI